MAKASSYLAFPMPTQRRNADGSSTIPSVEHYVDNNGIPYLVHRPPFDSETLDEVFHAFVYQIVTDPNLVDLKNRTLCKYLNGENAPNGPSLELLSTSTDGNGMSYFRPVWPARGLADGASWMKVGDNNQAQLVMKGIKEMPTVMKTNVAAAEVRT